MGSSLRMGERAGGLYKALLARRSLGS